MRKHCCLPAAARLIHSGNGVTSCPLLSRHSCSSRVDAASILLPRRRNADVPLPSSPPPPPLALPSCFTRVRKLVVTSGTRVGSLLVRLRAFVRSVKLVKDGSLSLRVITAATPCCWCSPFPSSSPSPPSPSSSTPPLATTTSTTAGQRR